LKKSIAILLTILMLFTLFGGAFRENVVKADSQPIWPMLGYNAQRTGQCPYDTSNNNGTLKWKFQAGDEIDSSPAIASDGTVYVGSDDGNIYAINPDGTLKWKYKGGSYYSSLTIASDGTIYVGSGDHYLYALNSNGTLKWKFQAGDAIFSSPAIAADGTIYLGSDDHYLYAINPGGTLKWKFKTDGWVSFPAIDSDGTIYLGSWDHYLYAINPSGTLKWKFETGNFIDSSPAIGSDGTIYVGSKDGYLYAINPNGTLKWKYKGGSYYFSPAIAADGTIYVGSWDHYLYAINPDGTLKWKFETGDSIPSSPAISSDGTIYVGSVDYYLYALNSNGTLKWKYKIGNFIGSSPAIGSDGTIYVGSYDNYLYAIGGQLNITASAGIGGSISLSGIIPINSGESKTFYISPSSGYKISNVKVDGVSKGAISSYTFTNITSDHTISATFEKKTTQTVIILQIGKTPFTVNGISNTLDSPPIIKNSRTLLPIRVIIEALGGSVSWDVTERKVTVSLSSITIELWIGKSIAKVNGVNTPIDSTNSKVVPEIINSRTMLPLRFVAESLGIDVQYDDKTKMIILAYVAETTPIVQLPVAPMLASPTNNSTLNNSNITFIWTAVTEVDYYKLQTIKDGLTLNSFESITTNSYTLPGTLTDGTYSWQVAAHNSAGWSSWSTPFTFSISTPQQLPEAPVLSLPATGSTFNNSEITLAWLPVTSADTYQVQVNKDSIVIHSATNITSTAYKIPSGTLSDGTYSWQVAAHNTAGWGSWSSPFVFSLRSQLTITDIAKFVDRVVYIEVTGYENGKPFAASGSGFIISSDGKIVTNYHVIDGATSGTVTLNDKTKFDILSVLGYSKTNDKDLAVLKINVSNVPVCSIGDSSNVQVGESVVAIGSPLGLQNSVSNGIVSKMWDSGIIQTTAPISHGSSGGPLFNMYGQVIGATEASYPDGENLNLAVPINWLKTLDTSLNMTLEQVYQKEYGSVPSLLPAPTLISPANNSVISTTTPMLTWTAVSGADYYIVGIMKGAIPDPDNLVWGDKPYSNSISVPSGYLVSGETYTWVVAAHNSSGYGDISDVWHFSIAQSQLTAPVLLSPDDKETWAPSLHNYAITFKWSPVTGASYYILWIGTGLSGVASTNIYKKQTTDTTFTFPTYLLPSGQIYTWAIGAVDSLGNIVGSVDRHFSIIKEKGIRIISPYNEEHTFLGLLSWASYPEADQYWVFVTDVYGNLVYTNITTISSDIVPSNKLILGKKYVWSVVAVKNSYCIAMSDFNTFYYGY
jgi:outer membrane protein assembly factor BamB/S1-C subfamily serine protease